MFFVTMIVVRSHITADVVVPSTSLTEVIGGRINVEPVELPIPAEQDETQMPPLQPIRDIEIRQEAVTGMETDNKVELLGLGEGSPADGSLTPWSDNASLALPRTEFFGTGGNAYHVVYVVDRSGSLLLEFDSIRREVVRSIARLNPEQDFHVILFSDGEPDENPSRRLIHPDRRGKQEAVRFLEAAKPGGGRGSKKSSGTDPLPGLMRAFDVLDKADNSKHGKIVNLLADADFSDFEKVRDAVRRRNGNRAVQINTYQYGFAHPDAVKFMKALAAENGGQYKFISPDE